MTRLPVLATLVLLTGATFALAAPAASLATPGCVPTPAGCVSACAAGSGSSCTFACGDAGVLTIVVTGRVFVEGSASCGAVSVACSGTAACTDDASFVAGGAATGACRSQQGTAVCTYRGPVP